MRLTIEIDSGSGFCNGVIRAVETAEQNLKQSGPIYSLGAIVHNSDEMGRLSAKGLRVIDRSFMEKMNGGTVLIRAHGEPPETYAIAENNKIRLIDCTCPVVLKLQERIRRTYRELQQGANGGDIPGQIVIFGKEGHAEVNGLTGQVGGDAVIIDKVKETDGITSGFSGIEKICSNKEIHLFSQTTKDPQEYKEAGNVILHKIARERGCTVEEASKHLHIHDTICKQVARRHTNLASFAANHDIILFVSGTESSNGKVLYELCRSANSATYAIQKAEEIRKKWLPENGTVGICGATSTPRWQLESVAEYLMKL